MNEKLHLIFMFKEYRSIKIKENILKLDRERYAMSAYG